MFFKYLIAFGLLSSAPVPEMDADGWVSVVRPEKEMVSEGSDERDPSIWVIFTKEMEDEKFLISFPSEPKYRYMDDDGKRLEVLSVVEGEEYRLQVMKSGEKDAEQLMSSRQMGLEGVLVVDLMIDEDGNWAEIVYSKDGSWFRERFITTDDHTFFFQTKSEAFEVEKSAKFIDSFDVEKEIRRN